MPARRTATSSRRRPAGPSAACVSPPTAEDPPWPNPLSCLCPSTCISTRRTGRPTSRRRPPPGCATGRRGRRRSGSTTTRLRAVR
jgi:hypothetical protein